MANFDIYQEITDRIIAEMESGIIPWEKPWTGVQGGAVNWVNQRPYSLINQFLLGGGGEWASFKQITEAGARSRRAQSPRSLCSGR